jgi:hypothetical protein
LLCIKHEPTYTCDGKKWGMLIYCYILSDLSYAEKGKMHNSANGFLCCMHICGCGKVDDGTESDVLWFG